MRLSTWACKGVAATAADAKGADALRIYPRIVLDEIHGAHDVTHPVGRFIRAAWHSAALSLITGIEGDGDKSCFGKLLGIEACYLVLAAPVRMCHHYGCIALSRVITSRRIDIRHHINAVHLVGHPMQIHLPRNILSDCILINQPEGIGSQSGALIPISLYFCHKTKCNKYQCNNLFHTCKYLKKRAYDSFTFVGLLPQNGRIWHITP